MPDLETFWGIVGALFVIAMVCAFLWAAKKDDENRHLRPKKELPPLDFERKHLETRESKKRLYQQVVSMKTLPGYKLDRQKMQDGFVMQVFDVDAAKAQLEKKLDEKIFSLLDKKDKQMVKMAKENWVIEVMLKNTLFALHQPVYFSIHRNTEEKWWWYMWFPSEVDEISHKENVLAISPDTYDSLDECRTNIWYAKKCKRSDISINWRDPVSRNLFLSKLRKGQLTVK